MGVVTLLYLQMLNYNAVYLKLINRKILYNQINRPKNLSPNQSRSVIITSNLFLSLKYFLGIISSRENQDNILRITLSCFKFLDKYIILY